LACAFAWNAAAAATTFSFHIAYTLLFLNSSN
jgi:hypothetical protein